MKIDLGDMIAVPPIEEQIGEWATKDGAKIAIADMPDKHLLNTICYLRRKGWWANADEAQAAFDSIAHLEPGPAYEAAFDRLILSYLPALEAMHAEAERRGLSGVLPKWNGVKWR
jgi:hypothetical protein